MIIPRCSTLWQGSAASAVLLLTENDRMLQRNLQLFSSKLKYLYQSMLLYLCIPFNPNQIAEAPSLTLRSSLPTPPGLSGADTLGSQSWS
eukprot:5015703-Pleurochrysis_carterae.AAC.1